MKKPLLYAIIYSVVVIIFKLVVYYTGSLPTTLGYFSHIITILLLTPFCYALIKSIRDKDRGGILGGREALKYGMTFVAISAVILSVFNYIFFEAAMGQFLVDYIRTNGPEAIRAEAARAGKSVTDAEITKMIEQRIASQSAFADTTVKLLGTVAYGLFSSFIVAVFLKKNRVA